jgi:Flp pilus assembly protein TadG
MLNHQNKSNNQGQVLILFAVTFLILMLFIGLAVDVGRLFIGWTNLRRATDSAVLAAAGQIREGRTVSELTAIARESMALNGADPTTIVVETCETAVVSNDPELCVTPRKKLVRITSTGTVPMAFLTLIGYHEVTFSANSIGEAASMDIVLVIDISESMAWDAASSDPYRDPSQCNAADPSGTDGYPGECQPFEEVKKAAAQFASRILNKSVIAEEDRLAIVTFANGWSAQPDEGTHYRTSGWTNDRAAVLNIIENLKVFEPGSCTYDDASCSHQTPYGACRLYNYACLGPIPSYPLDAYVPDYYCISCNTTSDFSSKTSTNIGGGLLLAGNIYSLQTREDSLWVVVMLTDGMANSTTLDSGDDITDFTTYPIGYCPNDPVFPLCQDENVSSRHANTSSSYDADDFARDMADFVGCMPTNQAAACGTQAGQGAVIFTIGLGSGVLDNTNEINNKPYGAELLRYISAVGYDGDPATDPCSGESDYTAWCGNYYYSPSGDQLAKVFEDIASRIFTRITH